MRENYPYFMVTFPSVHHALKFESMVKPTGLSFQLVPVPREISSSCGVAAKVVEVDRETLLNTIHHMGIEYDSIYLYEFPRERPRLIEKRG